MIARRTLIAGAAGAVALAAAPALAKEPPRIRRLSPKLDRILAADAPIETIATGIRWAEGPVWVRDGGYLLFSDPPANIMRRWSRQDGVSVFLQPSGSADHDPKLVREAGSNGLTLDRQGQLLVANSGGRSIDRIDLATKKRTIVVDRYRGKRFSSCNDVIVGRLGALYFTDPPYGFAGGDQSPLKEVAQNGVYRFEEGGQAVLVTGALTRPNGLALSPDERTLYVANSDDKDRRIVAIPLDAKGLPAGAPRTFLDASKMTGPGNPDGMKVAPDGTIFATAPGGLWVLTPAGERLGVIEHGAPIANCCFGEDGRTLFLTANDRVLRVPLKISGWRA